MRFGGLRKLSAVLWCRVFDVDETRLLMLCYDIGHVIQPCAEVASGIVVRTIVLWVLFSEKADFAEMSIRLD